MPGNAPLLMRGGSRAELERRIAKLRRACGCAEAMAGLAAGLALSLWHDWGGSSGLTYKIVAGVVSALAGAVIGKLLGLAVARYRLIALERRMNAIERRAW